MTTRPRIGVDGYSLSGRRAGVGRYCAELLTAVAEHRPDLDLTLLYYRLRPGAHQGSVADLEAEGVNVIQRPRALTRASELAHLKGVPVRYDVLLPRMDAYFFTRYWRPGTGRRPALTMIYDLSCYHAPDAAPESVVSRLTADVRSTVSDSEAIGVISNTIAGELTEMFPEVAGRLLLLRPGLSALPSVAGADALPLGLPPTFILHVGTLEPRKNLVTLIEAAVLVFEEHGFPLVLAGRRGWLDEPILQAIDAAGQAVRWVSDASDDALTALYSSAAVTVVASRYEGFGLPVLEAMNAGSPVICSDIAVFREVGGDAVTYADTTDAGALAKVVSNELLSGDREREARVAAGRLKAEEYGWAETADAFAEGLSALIESGGLTSELAWSPE